MHKIELDFSRLPDVSVGRSAWSMPDKIRDNLSKFPETTARCDGAMWLCYRVAMNTDSIRQIQDKHRETLFRSALAEFASMNDALSWDCEKHPPHRMEASSNPLVHFVRLLRHANIHLAKTPLAAEEADAIWIGAGSGGANHEFKTKIWIIPDLEIVRRLDRYRQYHSEDFEKMLEWFHLRQRTWGAPDLVWRAVESFAIEIVKAAGTDHSSRH